MNGMGRPPREIPRRVTLLTASGLTITAAAIVSPSLPGLQDAFAGQANVEFLSRLVLTAPALAIALTAPLLGYAADRYGRRPLLIAALVGFAAFGASGLFLPSLPAILVGRVLLGVAVAAIMTITTTLVGDYYAGAERERLMGWQSAAVGVGGVVFLTTAGALADLSWRAPFAIYLFALLLVPAAMAWLPEPSGRGDGTTQEARSGPARFPFLAVAVLFMLALLNSMAGYLVPTEIPFLLREMDIADPLRAGGAVAASTLAAALGSLAYAPIAARLRTRRTFALGFGLLGAGLATVAVAGGYPLVLVGMAFVGLGSGILMPNTTVALTSLAPPALRGRVIGGLTSCFFLGQFLTPAASQPLAAAYGLHGSFIGMGTLMLVVALVAGLAWLRDARRTSPARAPRPAAS